MTNNTDNTIRTDTFMESAQNIISGVGLGMSRDSRIWKQLRNG